MTKKLPKKVQTALNTLFEHTNGCSELPEKVQIALGIVYEYSEGDSERMEKIAGAYACGRACVKYGFRLSSPYCRDIERALWSGAKIGEST